ncbi:hypothetical protein ABW19_dt0205334 [Dactylella cylindrospora]|nr:hypothetical protein ABW19_dt0205334 [Dactylella cylindrospora]
MSGMLVNEFAGFSIVQEDGEAVIVVGSIAPSVPSVLPVLVSGDPLGNRSLLPFLDNFETSVVGNGSEVLESLVWGEPAVLFKDDWLVQGATDSGVVLDPLCPPLWGLAPPIRVEVESSVVNGIDGGLSLKVNTVGAVVGPVVALWVVESTLASNRDHVVGVEILDELGEILGPFMQLGDITVRRSWEISVSVSAAAGLVTQLPREDGFGVLVSLNDDLDVLLVGGNDLWFTVELQNCQRTVTWYWRNYVGYLRHRDTCTQG